MKTATVRQVRHAFPSVLRLVQNGETVAITSRRKVVATLSPPPAAKTALRRRPWSNLDKRWAELRTQPVAKVSGAELLSQDRDRY
jgi:antitoxin (DNA-binding transcriptional repressor) of toxin-antitoxin stability system